MYSKHKHKSPNDPELVNDIVDKLKKQGIFDKFRKDCLADVDTKVALLIIIDKFTLTYHSQLHLWVYKSNYNNYNIVRHIVFISESML